MELAEPDYGIWAGRPVREVMMQDAEAFQAWLEGAAPGRRVTCSAAGALWQLAG
jgi:broad specificity phosphatase PhoE